MIDKIYIEKTEEDYQLSIDNDYPIYFSTLKEVFNYLKNKGGTKMKKFLITHPDIEPKTIEAEDEFHAYYILPHTLTPAEQARIDDFSLGFEAKCKLISEEE